MWKIYKKTDNPSKGLKSPEATIDEIREPSPQMKIILIVKNQPTNEEYLLKLFQEYSNFSQLTSEWLGIDATVVNSEASIQGTSAAYHITVQEKPTIAPLDTGANISVIFAKCFQILTSKTTIIKITHTYSHFS